jgi:hypothetical protein
MAGMGLDYPTIGRAGTRGAFTITRRARVMPRVPDSGRRPGANAKRPGKRILRTRGVPRPVACGVTKLGSRGRFFGHCDPYETAGGEMLLGYCDPPTTRSPIRITMSPKVSALAVAASRGGPEGPSDHSSE